MQIVFQHPTTSDHYAADVAPEATGALCVQALIRDQFLEPRKHYDLQVVRTGRVIAPPETLAECQVQERDNVQVLRRETGA
jgi:hypothetical protein